MKEDQVFEKEFLLISYVKSKIGQPPLPRIQTGVSLTRSPLVISTIKTKSKTCEKVKFWEFDVLEIARQWTLIDFQLFQSIPLCQFIGKKWNKPRYSHKADEV